MKSTHQASKGLGAMTSEERQKIKTVLTKLNYSIEFAGILHPTIAKRNNFPESVLTRCKGFSCAEKNKVDRTRKQVKWNF
jgi:hypothetical protein